MPISSSGKSHSTCCICRERKPKFQSIPTELRHKIFIKTGHLFVAGARCCPAHLDQNNNLNDDTLNSLANSDKSTSTFFNRTELFALITDIRLIALKYEKTRIDFDNISSMKDCQFECLTGIGKADFEDLMLHVNSIRHSKNRSIKTCIGLLLVRLKTGMSYPMLSTVFNISKYSIRRSIVTARNVLTQNFTSQYIGFQNTSRQDIINLHTRPLAQELFGNDVEKPAILIADGTYIYIEKSNCFSFQRRSYSLHKNRPLVKPMVIVSSTGYIVSILGPYFADNKNNDASIIKHNFKTNMEQMNDWIRDGDVMVVDRGFRDAVEFLVDIGIHPKMPSFLEKGKKQHTTEEANSTRLITKIRWVVESVNGRLKRWKYLANIVPNSQIPYIGDDIRLVGALCNKYKPPINTGDEEEDQVMAAKMKVLSKKGNNLAVRVQEQGLDRRIKSWKNMDSENVVPDFPKLTEEELTNITIGVYQLKLARSYSCEHLSDKGEYIIMVNNDVEDVLRVKIQSRHTSSKTYMVFIEHEPASITGWYCQCKAGARIVGAFAHVSSVLWYLGFARHSNCIQDVKNWSYCLEDASHIPELIDDSDSDESVPEE